MSSNESGVFTMSGAHVIKFLLLVVAVFLVGLMLLTVALYSAFGWVGFLIMLGVALGGIFVIKSLAGKLIYKALSTSFATKGDVLKNAGAEVHSVETAPPPARSYDEDEENEYEEYSRHYYVDVTISPQPPTPESEFTAWDPAEIFLVRTNTPSGPLREDYQVGSVLEVHQWRNGEWVQGEDVKIPGPQRLKLLVGVQDGVNECRFRYYFEVFGRVNFP